MRCINNSQCNAIYPCVCCLAHWFNLYGFAKSTASSSVSHLFNDHILGITAALSDTPKHHLVGGWPTPLKNITSSVGMMAFPTEWNNKIHVPNHQPVKLWVMMSNIYIYLLHMILNLMKSPMECLYIYIYFTNLNCWAILGWLPAIYKHDSMVRSQWSRCNVPR